jgi:hypothetical protein
MRLPENLNGIVEPVLGWTSALRQGHIHRGRLLHGNLTGTYRSRLQKIAAGDQHK